MVIAGHNFIVHVVSPKRVIINDLLCTAYAGLQPVACLCKVWNHDLISSYTEAGSGFVLSQLI